MSFQDMWESFLGYNPDQANKNLLGEGFKRMGKNTTATDTRNALIGTMTQQPNALGPAGPAVGLAGKQIGLATSDWVKRLLTGNVGFIAPEGGGITPAPGVPKDLFGVGSTGDINFDWSKMMPSGADLASAGLSTGMNLLGVGNGPIGQGIKTAGAIGSAAAQGFANPVSDADAVFKLFRTLGII